MAPPGRAAPGKAAPESTSLGTIIPHSASCQSHTGNKNHKYQNLFILCEIGRPISLPAFPPAETVVDGPRIGVRGDESGERCRLCSIPLAAFQTPSLPVRRFRHDAAGRIGDIISFRSFLLRANILEDCLHIVIETGCMRVTHRPNFCDYRVRSDSRHHHSPVVRLVYKSPAVRIRPLGMPLRFVSALLYWRYAVIFPSQDLRRPSEFP